MVDTDAIAVPLLMVVDFTARLNTSGMIHDTPKPVNIKPMAAVTKYGNRLESNNPAQIKIPL